MPGSPGYQTFVAGFASLESRRKLRVALKKIMIFEERLRGLSSLNPP
jgi:hypothetical protein